VMLLKEMSRDSEMRGEALNSSCGRSLRAPPGYAYFRRIYTTSSIVHRPLGGAPGGCPLRPGRTYSVHWDTRRVVLALSGERVG
jgi:hypothetical protein